MKYNQKYFPVEQFDDSDFLKIHEVEESIRACVVNIVRSKLGGRCLSVILYGGYGRGEGAWVKHNDMFEQYNDMDLIVLVTERISGNEKDCIKKAILELSDTQWIDISFLTKFKARNFVARSVFLYDLLYCSKILYGNSHIPSYFKEVTQRNIPRVKEVETFFVTRIWTMLSTFLILKNEELLNEEKSLFFRYQLSKAILSVVDQKITLASQYTSFFPDKIEMATKYFTESETRLVRSAFDFKRQPKRNLIRVSDAIELHGLVYKFYKKHYYQSLSEAYGCNVIAFADIEKNYVNINRTLLGVVPKLRCQIALNLAQMHVFDVLYASKVGQTEVDSISKLLKGNHSSFDSLLSFLVNERL